MFRYLPTMENEACSFETIPVKVFLGEDKRKEIRPYLAAKEGTLQTSSEYTRQKFDRRFSVRLVLQLPKHIPDTFIGYQCP